MRKELVCSACGYKIRSLKTAYLDPKTGDFYHRECGIAAMKMSKNPAISPAQQKLFAIALGIKKGQIVRSYSPEAAKMADRMSVRKLEEFARTRFNPLQQNLLPEIATLALTGFGIGLGYKSAGALWNKVSKKKSNPQVDDKPDPKGQTCPKCGKVYHDYKWGGCGQCSCGYYFHPEWYGKVRNPKHNGKCAQCGSSSITLYNFGNVSLKSSPFDGFVRYTCKSCRHKGEFLYKLVKKTNPVSKRVHPGAFKMRAMYKGDVKAGHAEAAEYWKGGAAALFTEGNPIKFKTATCYSCGYKPVAISGDKGTCPNCGAMVVYTNPSRRRGR